MITGRESGGGLRGYQAGGREALNWRQWAMLTEVTRTIAEDRSWTDEISERYL